MATYKLELILWARANNIEEYQGKRKHCIFWQNWALEQSLLEIMTLQRQSTIYILHQSMLHGPELWFLQSCVSLRGPVAKQERI
jgi:hypothetical protein